MTTATTTKQDQEELEAELQKRAPRVIKHMNDDHMDSVKAYSMAFGEHPRCVKETKSAILTGLDREGFVLQVTLDDETVLENVRVRYQGQVKTAKDLHMEAIGMHRKAYDKLGVWYKLSNGYYTQAAQMVGFQLYKNAKKQPREVVALSVGSAAILAAALALAVRRKQ